MKGNLLKDWKLKKGCVEETGSQGEEKKETATMPMSRVQKKLFAVYSVLVFVGNVCTTYAYAAGDPLSVVNNLSTFIFSLIRAIGLILLGFGIVQVGLSLKSMIRARGLMGF